MKTKEKLLPIGTKVFDINYGWGEVSHHRDNPPYPIEVKYLIGGIRSYTRDGINDLIFPTQMLSLTEYDLTNGGFTPITEYDPNEIKKGDRVYAWDNEDFIVCGILEEIWGDGLYHSECYPYHIKNSERFEHCSKELPDFAKDWFK